MLREACYCRVSTDKDDQANSFESQMRFFKEYVDRQPEWELYEIYADKGITGTSTKKRVRWSFWWGWFLLPVKQRNGVLD